MPNPSQGYELVEGEGFATSVKEILGAVHRWDEIRRGLDWALNRGPTDPSFATRLTGNLWVVEISGPPKMAVFYEVNEKDKVVTYTGLGLSPD